MTRSFGGVLGRVLEREPQGECFGPATPFRDCSNRMLGGDIRCVVHKTHMERTGASHQGRKQHPVPDPHAR